MPNEKVFISRRHARRKKKNIISQLMSVNNDSVIHVSNETNCKPSSFHSSIVESSDSMTHRHSSKTTPNIRQNEYDCTSMAEYACNSSDSFSLSEDFTNEANPHLVFHEDSDFHNRDDTLNYSEGQDTNLRNSDMYPNSESDVCSSSDSKHDSYVHESHGSTDHDVTYAFTVNPTAFTDSLKNMITKHNATLSLTTDILRLLSPILPFLPQDGRTLLRTPKYTETTKLDNGELCYFGLENGIRNKLKGCVLPAGHVIQIDFNIDGLPLFKSSSIEFWPILGRICSIDDQEPFAVAIFCGKGKPQPQELFLSQFVNEVQSLQKNGIKHENSVHEVTIRCFSCDAPARSWLKCIKSHSAIAACERCTILATVQNKKLFYPTTNADHPKRKDEDFRQSETVQNTSETTNTQHDRHKAKQRKHITGKSLLLKILCLGLVTQFILDSMHLIYLGVVKRLFLKYWVDGKRPFKLSSQNIETADKTIRIIRSYIPSDFARKGRSLLEIRRFKATELRLVLLYTGPIFLHDVISGDRYSHFILLHAAITILSSKRHISNYLDIAKKALKRFVSEASEIYGNEFVVYNVHSLSHIADDAENYGPLDNYSCFTFENYLKTLKYRIRANTCPLQQISNRIIELNNMNKAKNSDLSAQYCPIGVKHHINGCTDAQYFECKSLKYRSMKISACRPDNVVSANGKTYVIKQIFCIHGQYKCIGTSFRYMEDLYTDPLSSARLNIFYGRCFGDSHTFSVDQISFKCVMMPFKEGFAIFPIIHQL